MRKVVTVMAALMLMGAAQAVTPLGRWRAVEIGGQPSARGVETTLEIDGSGRASGNGGCNGYGGPVRHDGERIGFGAIAATRMGCPAPQADQENRFFQALGRAARWRIDGVRLVLVDERGGAVAVFLPMRGD